MMEFRMFKGNELLGEVYSQDEAEDWLDELCALDPDNEEDYYYIIIGEDD